MTVYEGKEARESIRTLMDTFATLRSEDNFNQRVLTGRHKDDLVKDLVALGMTKQAAMPSHAIDFYAHQAQVHMAQDLPFRVLDLTGDSPARADKLEVAATGAWQMLNPSGIIGHAIDRIMIARPFVGVFMVPVPFKVPSKDKMSKANAEYRATYFPARLELDNGHQSAFFEEYGRVPVVVREYVRDLMDVMADYNKKPGEDRTPFQILEQDFPWLRANFAMNAEDTSGMLGTPLKVCMRDDGTNICHYIDLGSFGRKDGAFVSISSLPDDEPQWWPNPIGRPLFRFASAFYNADAEKPEDRYTSFMNVLTSFRYVQDVGNSVLASMAATLPTKVVQPPESAIAHMLGLDSDALREAFMDSLTRQKGDTITAIGKFEQFDPKPPALLLEQMRDAKLEYNRMLPAQAPDEITIRNADTSSLVLQKEMKDANFSQPKTAKAVLVRGLVEDVFSLWRAQKVMFGANVDEEKWHYTTTGNEQIKGKSIDAGKKFVFDIATLGKDSSWYNLTVEPEDNSPSARALDRHEAEERRAADNILDEDYFGLLRVKNVTDYIRRLEVQRLMAGLKPALASGALVAAMQQYSLTHGVDLTQVIGQMQAAMPPAAPGPPQGGNPGVNSLTVNSPSSANNTNQVRAGA